MSRKFLTAIDLAKNELQNAVIQNLGSAPGSPVKGQVYYDSTANILYWWNGTAWVSASGGAGVSYGSPAASAVGDASADGVATTVTRSDHKHAREAFGAVAGPPAFGAAAANGSATTVTRSDHVHGLPAHDAAAHTAILGTVTAETTFGGASNNGASPNVSRADHQHGNPAHTFADHSAYRLDQWAAPTADLNLNSRKITSLADPTAATDAANKQYVDTTAQGLDAKASVRVATTAHIASLSGTMTIDGIAVTAGQRVLVKDQNVGAVSQNGIYVVAAGAWSRATDADTAAELNAAYVFVEEGTVNVSTGWVCSFPAGSVLGTDPVTWTQFSSAGVIVAGAGLTKTGNTLNVGAGLGIIANADDVAANFTGSGGANGTATTVARGDHTHTAASTSISFNVGGSTSQVLNHALGTRDVIVNVYRNSTPWDTVECDVERTDTANVTLRFAVAPAASEYRAVIQA